MTSHKWGKVGSNTCFWIYSGPTWRPKSVQINPQNLVITQNPKVLTPTHPMAWTVALRLSRWTSRSTTCKATKATLVGSCHSCYYDGEPPVPPNNHSHPMLTECAHKGLHSEAASLKHCPEPVRCLNPMAWTLTPSWLKPSK